MLCSVKFVNKIEYRIWPPFCFSAQCTVLLWQLTAACIKTGRPQIARRAVDLIESRLHRDCWPEYYDGKLGRYVGKQARKYQTWSIAGYLVAKMLLEDPSHIGMISLEEDKLMKPVIKRSASWPQLWKTALGFCSGSNICHDMIFCCCCLYDNVIENLCGDIDFLLIAFFLALQVRKKKMGKARLPFLSKLHLFF